MNNKVLVKLIIPGFDDSYDVFIPVNEVVWKVKKMLLKSVQDLGGITVDNTEYVMLNKSNSRVYNNNDIIVDTDIRNGTELILMPL